MPGLGVIGQFLAQGPYLPLRGLQARWIAAGVERRGDAPDVRAMRHAAARPRPPLDAHNALALTLATELRVAPEPMDWPELCEPLLFGPMLPRATGSPGPVRRPMRESGSPSTLTRPRGHRWIPATSRRCAASVDTRRRREISGQTVSAAQPAGACRPARSPRSGSA